MSTSKEVISTTLKTCLGVLPVLLILGLREYSRKCYTTFAGVLPQKCCSASGTTPILKKQCVGPLLWEYSHKSGIVLTGVLPRRLSLYSGSDLDIIYTTICGCYSRIPFVTTCNVNGLTDYTCSF